MLHNTTSVYVNDRGECGCYESRSFNDSGRLVHEDCGLTLNSTRLLRVKHYAFVVVVNAKPARAVALLLGDHDLSHASTDPPGGFHCPSGPDRSISLVVSPDDVSTGRWVVDQGTGRRGSGGPCVPGHLDVVSQRDRRGRYDGC